MEEQRLSFESYRGMPSDAFCTPDQLRRKNEFRRNMEHLYGKPFAVVQAQEAAGRKTFTDSERKAWLIERGYARMVNEAGQKKWDQRTVDLTDAQFVDFCLAEKLCPAYWRHPHKGELSSENGMVVAKAGDRERIDQIMAEEK